MGPVGHAVQQLRIARPAEDYIRHTESLSFQADFNCFAWRAAFTTNFDCGIGPDFAIWLSRF
jgi:hypothetical protein